MSEQSIPYPTIIPVRSIGRVMNDAVKRFFEVLIVLVALLFIWPVFLVVAYLIRRDSPGPVFYRGPRAGRYGRVFGILKFRTMYERPASYAGPKVTAQDDPRITPNGAWLRHTKLNELPQLWNVLVGDMSLVGPRPEDPDIAAGWPEELRREILSVRPGITSPASVIYRNEEALLKTDKVMLTYLESVLPSKLRLDQLYVRNRSIWLDLDIVFWTLMLLILRLGSYTPPEKMLFIGPVTRLVRRHVSWLIVDAGVTFGALTVMGLFWPSFEPFAMGWALSLGVALVFASLFSLTGALFGVQRISWPVASPYDAFDLLLSAALAASLALLINQFLLPTPLLPLGLILTASALACVGFVVIRYRSRLIRGLAQQWGSRQIARERVLIIGGGSAGQFVAWLLSSYHGPGFFHVVGFVDDDPVKQDTRIRGIDVIGGGEDIPRLVRKYDIGILVFAIHNISAEDRQRLLRICAETQARVVMVPDILGALNAAVMLDLEEEETLPSLGGEASETELPWSTIPSSQVDRWLDDIVQVVEQGDLAEVQAHIQALRQSMQDSYAQLAHLSEVD